MDRLVATAQLPVDEDVRTTILEVATRLFAERGFHGTSIQTIADEVGVSKPTLVYHFGSKDQLRAEVVGGVLGHWRDQLPRMMAAAASGGARVDALLSALFGFFLADRNRARLMLRETLDDPAAVRALLVEHLQPWTRLLSEALRAGQAQGLVHPELDAEAYPLLLITTAIGVIAIGDRASALFDPEPPLTRQLDELLRMARAAIFLPRPTHTLET